MLKEKKPSASSFMCNHRILSLDKALEWAKDEIAWEQVLNEGLRKNQNRGAKPSKKIERELESTKPFSSFRVSLPKNLRE